MSPKIPLHRRIPAWAAAAIRAHLRARKAYRGPILPQSPERASRARDLAQARAEARRVAESIRAFHGPQDLPATLGCHPADLSTAGASRAGGRRIRPESVCPLHRQGCLSQAEAMRQDTARILAIAGEK